MLPTDLARIARVRNAIEILSTMQVTISPEAIGVIYHKSEEQGLAIQDMLLPSNIYHLAQFVQ